MNNKQSSYLILFIFLFQIGFSRDVYFTRSGKITFFSTAPLEDIEAINTQVSCVLNMETGEVAFRVPIPAFTFENALMQEHFNENYLESDIYPTAGFKGKIENWSELSLSKEPQNVTLSGDLTIHGVINPISEMGQISIQDGVCIGKSKFNITVADYGIEIPKIVRDNIAKIVDVTVNLELKKK